MRTWQELGHSSWQNDCGQEVDRCSEHGSRWTLHSEFIKMHTCHLATRDPLPSASPFNKEDFIFTYMTQRTPDLNPRWSSTPFILAAFALMAHSLPHAASRAYYHSFMLPMCMPSLVYAVCCPSAHFHSCMLPESTILAIYAARVHAFVRWYCPSAWFTHLRCPSACCHLFTCKARGRDLPEHSCSLCGDSAWRCRPWIYTIITPHSF